MKVLVYGSAAEERPVYEAAAREGSLSFTFAAAPLCLENADETRGYEALIVVTRCHITAQVAKVLAKNGVRYVATRSAGTDHLDLAALRAAGIRAANVPFYAPCAIAEHTILLALALLRNLKREARLLAAGDYSLGGLRGRQLGSMTAGVIGTGRIGCETIRLLKGFDCRVLACDPYPNPRAAQLAEYTDRETLLRQADIVFLHCPLTPESTHLINAGALTLMKPGAYLVNTARGGLVDAGVVLRALETQRLAGFAFDVYEHEETYLRRAAGTQALDDTMRALLAREDVVYTAHIAFFTDQAIQAMIEVTIQNLTEFAESGSCKNEVK